MVLSLGSEIRDFVQVKKIVTRNDQKQINCKKSKFDFHSFVADKELYDGMKEGNDYGEKYNDNHGFIQCLRLKKRFPHLLLHQHIQSIQHKSSRY